MRPVTTSVLAVTAVLLGWRTTVDQGMAKVVHDTGHTVSNPAVETGGHKVPPQPPPPVPYSLIGAIASEGNWMMQCALWPWQQFGSWAWFRHRGHDEGLRFNPPFVSAHDGKGAEPPRLLNR